MMKCYREVSETYIGLFPTVRIQSDCRCPGSRPRIYPQSTTLCINNSAAIVNSQDGGDTSRVTVYNSSDAALRLDVNAHPLEYVNDGQVGSFWLSTALQQISLSLDFGDVFQVRVSPRHWSVMPRPVTKVAALSDSDGQSDRQTTALLNAVRPSVCLSYANSSKTVSYYITLIRDP